MSNANVKVFSCHSKCTCLTVDVVACRYLAQNTMPVGIIC